MSSSVTATFVFTDLVDSTATAARLGPQAAEELRQAHFRLLRGAVAGSGGTEVKNLGDGLMVMYSSPSRALSGAVGMAQAIDHHNRSEGEPLGVRIGLSAGEAVEEDGDYFGDPVVEAARLCAVAQGGQILAAELVRLMVGRHATQTFVDLGPLELKGLPEPVNTVEVQWEPATVEGSVPLPGRLVGAASNALFGFFGRSSELDAFTEARKRARTSEQCQTVFVAGEAGMGKTSLVAQAARTAHGEGTVVLFGHSDEGLGVAYQPWIEVTSALVRHIDPEVFADVRSAQRGALARLVPDIGDGGDRVGDPDTERLLLLEGIAELLAAVSAREPVMVVLDDLHWADTASLQVVRHVIASPTPTNLTIAITYRDTDLGRGDALTQMLADLHREANVTRIALRGLEDVDLVDLLAAAAGHDLDDNGVGLAHILRRETNGNPFFTGELLRHLGESGGIVLNDEGRWVLTDELDELGLPNSIRDVVGRRVERLGVEPLGVLTLASVIGREFDVDLLAQLADTDEDALLDHLDAAVAAALLAESDTAGRYRFTHALTQHSLYDELSPTRRRRAHERVAEVLESGIGEPDAGLLAELAHHWVAASRPSDVEKALDYVWRAGDEARDGLAPDDAARWYRQALDLLKARPGADERRRARLLAELGAAQRRAGQPEYRETLRDAVAAALELEDTDAIVQAALGYTIQLTALTADDEAMVATTAALERIPDDHPARPLLLAACACAYDSSLEQATRRELSRQALDAAREQGDPATLVKVFNLTEVALVTPDRLDESIRDIQEAVALADRLGDPVLRVSSRFDLVWVRYQQCDPQGAEATLEDMVRIGEQVGLPFARWQIALLLTGRSLLRGDVQGAEEVNDRALDIGLRAGIPDAFGVHGGILFSIREHQGRLDELADFFIDVAQENPSITSLRFAVPRLHASLGRYDAAAETLTVEAAGGFAVPFNNMWMDCMASLLEAVAAVTDEAAARVLVERVAPYAEHVIAPAAVLIRGAMARPLACAATMLGEYDRAEHWFAITHDIHRRLQAPFWVARGQLDHADLCLARRADGDLERARDLVSTAAATAAEYGLAGLTQRADKLLADF
jgi:class 3 adenylate cyclase